MFKSLREQIGGGKNRDFIDQEHVIISNIIKQQSEHDFPRGSGAAKIGFLVKSILAAR
jgi:hypothetical protein